MDWQRVMTALGARRSSVRAELLLLGLLLLVGVLNLLESRRQGHRLDSDGRGLGPGATPGAHGATKSLVHAEIATRRPGTEQVLYELSHGLSEHVDADRIGASAHTDGGAENDDHTLAR